MSENCCIFNPRVKNHEANVTNESKPKWLLTLNKTDTRMRYVFNVFFVEKADRFKREKCMVWGPPTLSPVSLFDSDQ